MALIFITKKIDEKNVIQTKSGCVPITDMQTPSSLLIILLWMMGSVLYSMETIIKKISDFYFSSYREKSSKIYDF